MDPLTYSLMLKMRHNRVYTAITLARLFGVSEQAVEAALAGSIADGTVRVCSNARRSPGYCLSGVAPVGVSREKAPDAASETDGVATSVATRLVTRRFDCALSGYENQLQQQRSLAMLARR